MGLAQPVAAAQEARGGHGVREAVEDRPALVAGQVREAHGDVRAWRRARGRRCGPERRGRRDERRATRGGEHTPGEQRGWDAAEAGCAHWGRPAGRVGNAKDFIQVAPAAEVLKLE
jgi:hypothetical protein